MKRYLTPDQMFPGREQSDQHFYLEGVDDWATLLVMGTHTEAQARVITDGGRLAGEYLEVKGGWVKWRTHDADCDAEDGYDCPCNLRYEQAFPEIYLHEVPGSYPGTMIHLCDEVEAHAELGMYA